MDNLSRKIAGQHGRGKSRRDFSPRPLAKCYPVLLRDLFGENLMRVLLAPVIIALLIQPAYSQKPTLHMGMGGDKEVDPRVQQYRNDVEREYKETLDKIP